MVDWARKTGQRIIQTLPINDTILYHTNYDSYPYNAVSVYALHPIYLHLDKIGKIKIRNGKRISMLKLELNEKHFRYQNVMRVNGSFLKKFIRRNLKLFLLRTITKHFLKRIKNG